MGLHRFTKEKFMKIRGVGKVKTIQLLCILELSARLAKAEARKTLCFRNPSTIAGYYMEEMRHLSQEHMKLLMLDTKSNLIAEKNIYKGTVNASLVEPREIFVEAVKREAVSIILLHNHPSGDPAPSREDLDITGRVAEAGKIMNVSLTDHIIIGDHCYYSFKEKRLLE